MDDNLKVIGSENAEDISRPETVVRLRNMRKSLHLTVTQVCSMMTQADYGVSETTIRRFFNDDVPADTNWRAGTVEAINDFLVGTGLCDYDQSKARLYFEECRELRASIRDYDRSTADFQARLEFYRSLVGELRSENKFLREEIEFLRGRLEYISPEKECLCDKRQTCPHFAADQKHNK